MNSFIVMDGWTDCWNLPFINFTVSSISSPYFLKSIDCSSQENDTMILKDQLSDAIVEVGPSNVVQVVTNAALVCKATKMMDQKEYKLVTSLIIFLLNLNSNELRF